MESGNVSPSTFIDRLRQSPINLIGFSDRTGSEAYKTQSEATSPQNFEINEEGKRRSKRVRKVAKDQLEKATSEKQGVEKGRKSKKRKRVTKITLSDSDKEKVEERPRNVERGPDQGDQIFENFLRELYEKEKANVDPLIQNHPENAQEGSIIDEETENAIKLQEAIKNYFGFHVRKHSQNDIKIDLKNLQEISKKQEERIHQQEELLLQQRKRIDTLKKKVKKKHSELQSSHSDLEKAHASFAEEQRETQLQLSKILNLQIKEDYKKGLFDRTEKKIQSAIKYNSENFKAIKFKTFILRDQGKYDEALAFLDKATASFHQAPTPILPKIFLVKANLTFEMARHDPQKYELALEIFKELEKVSEGKKKYLGEALIGQGACLVETKRPSEALEKLTAGQKLNPESSRGIHYILSVTSFLSAQLSRRKDEESIKLLEN